jgi:hypothetical protein
MSEECFCPGCQDNARIIKREKVIRLGIQTKECDELKNLARELWTELQRWHGKPYEHGCKCCELQERAEKILEKK